MSQTVPRPWQRLSPGWRVVLSWLATRALIGLIYLTPAENYLNGDAFYYWRKLGELGTSGLAEVMLEYPVPAVWVLQLPYVFGGGHELAYVIGFAVLMLVLDAAFTALLWRSGGPNRSRAVAFWILFLVAVGPLAYFRFDLLPAVLVGAALVLSATRPAVAGVLAALGAGVKLWPALVWPALITRSDGSPPERLSLRVRTTVGFGVTGVVLAGTSLVLGGWQRLVSPLTWQSDRGLQIESIAATPLMLGRLLQPDVWQVDLSRYNAYELVAGPGIEALLTVTSLATAAGMLVIVGLVVVALLQRVSDGWRIGMIVLTVILVLIVTNKTFSPQYVVWLGGPVAYLLLTAGPARMRTTTMVMWAVLGVATVTHVIYPLYYTPLFRGGPMLAVPTIALVVRNLALCVLTGWTVLLAFRRQQPIND